MRRQSDKPQVLTTLSKKSTASTRTINPSYTASTSASPSLSPSVSASAAVSPRTSPSVSASVSLSSGEFEELDTSPSVEARHELSESLETIFISVVANEVEKFSETLFLVHNGRSEVTSCSMMSIASIKHKVEYPASRVSFDLPRLCSGGWRSAETGFNQRLFSNILKRF